MWLLGGEGIYLSIYLSIHILDMWGVVMIGR